MSINRSPVKQTLDLAYFTVIYNILEGLISVGGGILTGSISLIGFGLDSFVESLSSLILIWRFRKNSTISQSDTDETENKTIKFISYTFFILGTYVFYEAIKRLFAHQAPEHSLLGVVIALVSIAVMTVLYKKKRSIGMDNHIRSLVADSKQTLACIFMSITMLIGLGLNYFYGIWWADAVAGIAIAGFLFREGYNTYKEKKLCMC